MWWRSGRSRWAGFSIRALGDGWEERRELDSVVFRGPAGTGAHRTTIAVRAVGRAPGDCVGERTAETVIPATEEVLGALPGAADLAAVACPLAGCAAFALTFTPPSRPVARYHGRHV